MRLTITKGLPGSGKSYWSKEQVRKTKTKTRRVNKDDLRNMLNDGIFRRGATEKFVLETERRIVEEALKENHSIIVDNTHFNPIHEKYYRDLADKYGAEFIIKDFTHVPVETCIERDIKRPNGVGERVIRKMWRENIAIPQKRYIGNTNKPAIIFDIDGTLAMMNGRSPYDQHKVDTDLVVEDVATLVELFEEDGYSILIFTGRTGDKKCRAMTKRWLEKNEIVYDEFEMRVDGDVRQDAIIKKEFYDKHKDSYDIQYVIDDRLQVCRMWYEIGLTLLKVGDPDLEF